MYLLYQLLKVEAGLLGTSFQSAICILWLLANEVFLNIAHKKRSLHFREVTSQ